mgnify:FL=1
MELPLVSDELKQLKQKLEDFDSLVSSIDDIIFEIRDDGVILNCWTSTPEQLFYEKEFIVNKSIAELFPVEFSETLLYILNKSFKKRTGYVLKYKSPYDSNPDQWFKLKTKIINNKTDRLTVVVTNITREQRLEAEMQIKEEKFNRAFKNSSIGMLLLNRSLKVMEYNQELQSILGYTIAEEMLEKPISEFIHEESLDLVTTATKQVKSGEKEKAIIEARCIAKEDKSFYCLINISSVRDMTGKLVYFLCQIQDLSLFKNNEKKLNQQNELLEKRNYELKVRVNQLEAYNQILTHNLRTPISNINMIIEQLSLETDEHEKQVLTKLLKKSNFKFLKLFDKLIETVEIQNSNDSLFKTSNMDEIYQNLTNQFQSKIDSKELQLDCHFEIIEIAFPAIYIYNIMHYLINESLKLNSSGKKVTIKIWTERKEDFIVIKIENDCESQRCFGIEKDLESTDEDIDENSLLDLHLAKQQILNFGGNINISRNVDFGNQVTINLPLAN